MAISKVVYGQQVLIDLTSDTVTADVLKDGYLAHGADGEIVVGTCTYDSDTTDANALAGEIIDGKVAYVNKNRVVGTMPNNGGVKGTINSVNDVYQINSGYHDGSGTVSLKQDDKDQLVASNIKSGVTILGVEGSYAGEAGVGQVKTVTPTKTGFSVLPDTGYDYLTKVEVSAIPYSAQPNPQGGTTVTIA